MRLREFVHINDSPDDGCVTEFHNPDEIITAHTLEEVLPALQRVDEATRNGKYAAGFIAYEAGYAFEERLAALNPKLDPTLPLVWFAICKHDFSIPWQEDQNFCADHEFTVSDFQIHCDADQFEQDIGKVHGLIAAGDVYQINHTIRSSFRFEGSAGGLYAQLRRGQSSRHIACIRADDFSVVSLSPELFLEKKGDVLRTRPMKGTAPRGRFTAEDEQIEQTLQTDEKSRAENLMIVDLLRNDMARVCEPGSVTVPDLFTVERYLTLMTMTSTVEGRTQGDKRLAEIMPKLFPCGSVTGAPKIRAMEMIHQIEQSPRGLYTGAIGMVQPNGDFSFNVAIRTAVIDANGKASLGIGAGIVADSKADLEFEECKLKARFLTDPLPTFEIFETTRWTPEEGFFLLDRHIERLWDSYTLFRGDEGVWGDLRERLADEVKQFEGQPTRVRFAFQSDGHISISHRPLEASDMPSGGKIDFAETVMDSGNRFLFHKTSVREVYNQAMQDAAARGLLDLIFCNQHGFITEGARTNIYIEKDGTLLTPPISDGLLAGTMRAELLATGRAQEAQLTPQDLRNHPCFISNSVMGLVPVQLTES